MHIQPATDAQTWDDFLKRQRFSPFLQCWTMGEVYRKIGQEPIRLEVRTDQGIVGLCQAIIVPARRGRHLMAQYGPIVSSQEALTLIVDTLKKEAEKERCAFIRVSPFWPEPTSLRIAGAKPSPLHLLAEHIWYLPLTGKTEEELLMGMRKTTRNLVRRAKKDGVTVECSQDPVTDVEQFIALHDETRRRHKFTPYTNDFFRAQVKEFASKGNVLVYLARHEGRVIASSIHMQFGGETSYHHGASIQSKIPASYLLQWQAITDALRRQDRLYNFWGIAPVTVDPETESCTLVTDKHPFAGVTLFKTGFGGQLLNLTHCIDLPITPAYRLTRLFEQLRKWKRGF